MEKQRRDDRTSLFVAAMAHFEGRSAAVRIRNISSTGMLIQGADLPKAAAEVTIRRGQLSATGRVVRTAAGTVGVALSEPIDAAVWLPAKGGQQDVDRMIHYIRSNGMTHADAAMQPSPPENDIAGKLRDVRQILEMLSNELSSDPEILMRHSQSVQQLDLASQILRQLENDL